MNIDAETIETDRLVLRPLAADHADEMAVVLADPALHTFTGGSPVAASALRDRYERMLTGSPDPAVSWCNWVIELRAAGRLAGTVQATISPSDRGLVAEIAWVVGVPWQRRGIAGEAAGALADWLRTKPVAEIIAHVHPAHTASNAVARAAGLAPTDERHDGEVLWTARAAG